MGASGHRACADFTAEVVEDAVNRRASHSAHTGKVFQPSVRVTGCESPSAELRILPGLRPVIDLNTSYGAARRTRRHARPRCPVTETQRAKSSVRIACRGTGEVLDLSEHSRLLSRTPSRRCLRENHDGSRGAFPFGVAFRVLEALDHPDCGPFSSSERRFPIWRLRGHRASPRNRRQHHPATRFFGMRYAWPDGYAVVEAAFLCREPRVASGRPASSASVNAKERRMGDVLAKLEAGRAR